MSGPIPSLQALRALDALARPFPHRIHAPRLARTCKCSAKRTQHTVAAPSSTKVSALRKHTRVDGRAQEFGKIDVTPWDLTVGIEIHAELSTPSKVFSTAGSSIGTTPNTRAALFDTALPGAQPRLQKEVLLPALRAALALECQIQEISSWDRKHYFWWDQPQGYQITQHYEPFAVNGRLILYPWDERDPRDATNERGEIVIGIKQVQIEQDTAKTVLQPPDTFLLDFNRAGVPLVEIITRPDIKSPKTAAAVVKKVQGLLHSVCANSTGMEMGGLRADVNVSVKQTGTHGAKEYDGIQGLGQRTEIKNLSSFKAVEEAVAAERDRQIEVLESGGLVVGETRGWALGASTTRRLRGKEGEVDYRYMPDPELEALHISGGLVEHIQRTLPASPDYVLSTLSDPANNRGLSVKDAKTLLSADDGKRLEFYYTVVEIVHERIGRTAHIEDAHAQDQLERSAKISANLILMDVPAFLKSRDLTFPYYYGLDQVSDHSTNIQPVLGAYAVATIVALLMKQMLTPRSARSLLQHCRYPTDKEMQSGFSSLNNDFMELTELRVTECASKNGLLFSPLEWHEYADLARDIVAQNPDTAEKARKELMRTKGSKRGKLMWLVGQMLRSTKEGNVDAKVAEQSMWNTLAEHEDCGLEKWGTHD